MSVNLNSDFYLEIFREPHSWKRRTRPDLEGKGEELTGKYSYDYNTRLFKRLVNMTDEDDQK